MFGTGQRNPGHSPDTSQIASKCRLHLLLSSVPPSLLSSLEIFSSLFRFNTACQTCFYTRQRSNCKDCRDWGGGSDDVLLPWLGEASLLCSERPFEETEVADFLGAAPMHTPTFSKLLSLCRILQLYSKAEAHCSHNCLSKFFKLDLDTGIYTSPSAFLELYSIPYTYREDACVCKYMVFPFKVTHLVSGRCALKKTTSGVSI